MSRFWQPNLEALRGREDRETRALYEQLASRGPGANLGLKDREDNPLPGFLYQGRARSLISTFDAAKEAQRWSQGWSGGTVAVFGGAGRRAADALNGLQLAFWVEPRVEVWQSLFTWEDWTTWIERSEWIPIFRSPSDFQALVLDRYHPLWDGAFRTLDWKAATNGQEALWDPYRGAVSAALEALASDTSTQARFGERWYRNALRNLKHLEEASVPGCPGALVVVAGAGPTLGDALENPRNLRWLEERPETGDRLFSTDTALPALTARGIAPDLVLCLDGQLPTLHHFVPARPAGVPLAADLASLPLLGRVGMPVVRYLSGHPFGTVVRRVFPELPVLDGSLGNVSGLALNAALALGARHVETWGVDFGYRNGQAYARGAYVYDLAQKLTSRLTPLESRLAASCYGARGRQRSRINTEVWDTTPLLRDYRERWNGFSGTPAPIRLAHGGSGPRWETFSRDWHDRLESLPFPSDPSVSFHSFVRQLPTEQRQDWLALWPLALALHRQSGASGHELLQTAKRRALSLLD